MFLLLISSGVILLPVNVVVVFFCTGVPAALNLFFVLRRDETWDKWRGLSGIDAELRNVVYCVTLGFDVLIFLFVIYAAVALGIYSYVSVYMLVMAVSSFVFLSGKGLPVKTEGEMDLLRDTGGQEGVAEKTLVTKQVWIVINAILAPILLLALYGVSGLYNGVFIPSRAWAGIGCGISILGAAAFLIWLSYAYKTGQITPRIETRKPKLFSYIVIGIIFWITLWMALIFGAGKLATVFSGSVEKQVYSYSKSEWHYIYIDNLDVVSFGRFNLQPEDYAVLPSQSSITIQQVHSWFGSRLTGYYFHDFLRPVSTDNGVKTLNQYGGI
jgi:hypothetical protein